MFKHFIVDYRQLCSYVLTPYKIPQPHKSMSNTLWSLGIPNGSKLQIEAAYYLLLA